MKRSWVEVNLKQIAQNYNIYRQAIAKEAEIMAVVKANAYGHGDVQVSSLLSGLGVKNFAVSNLDEAIRLRKNDIKGQILVLGYTPVELAHEIYKFDITQALLSREYAEKLSLQRYKVKTQFAIDTGMNRIGLNADNPQKCADIIHRYAKIFDMTGIFTHLCVADTPSQNEFTQMQKQKFDEVVQKTKDVDLKFIHCMNSAGGIWQESYGNLVRLGIILYGLKPDYLNILPDGIRPAMKWKSVISMIKDVKEGETIGYGRTYLVKKPLKVATISTGYADGYNRLLSNRGYVFIDKKRAPIVGRICMDQFMIDVTDIATVEIGDEVDLLTDSFTADDMGKILDTIGYEVVCNISSRVERVYIKEETE